MAEMQAIFGTAHHVQWWQECARAVLILVYALLLVRLTGRRIIGKWSALDIMVSVVVGSSLSRVLTGNAPLWGTLLAILVLFLLHALLSRIVAHWPSLSALIEGRAIEIARDGAMIDHRRRRHLLSQADLDEALRQSGVETIDETRRVTLEPSGRLSVLKR